MCCVTLDITVAGTCRLAASANKQTVVHVRVLYSDLRQYLSSASYRSNIFDLANHIYTEVS